jgi:hypothetical protein
MEQSSQTPPLHQSQETQGQTGTTSQHTSQSQSPAQAIQEQIQGLRAKGYDADQIIAALASQAEKVQKVARGRREQLAAAEQKTATLEARLAQLEERDRLSRTESAKARISPVTDSLLGKLKSLAKPATPAQTQAPAQAAADPAPQGGYVPYTYHAQQTIKSPQGGRPVQVATVARTMNVPANIVPGTNEFWKIESPEVRRQVFERYYANKKRTQNPR